MHKNIEYRLAFLPHGVTRKRLKNTIYTCMWVCVGMDVCEREEEQQRVLQFKFVGKRKKSHKRWKTSIF